MAEEKLIPQLFKQLKLCGEDGEHERGIKIANKILESAGDDADALRCKVVSMVQLGQFKDAISFIKSSGGDGFHVEKAYCHYRCHELDDALAILKNANGNSSPERELLAQVLYRMEQYKESYGVYEGLIRNCDDDYSDEREANMVAMGALAVSSSGGVSMENTREDTYELCYNKACRFLAHGRTNDAESLLVKAQDLCRETLLEDDPDTTQEDIEDELALSRVQLAFCAQLQGKSKDAIDVYNSILRSRPSDAALAAVAANNIVTIHKDKDVFDSRKKIKVAAAEGLEQKLTLSQRRAIAFNRCLFYLYTNQSDNFRSAVATLEKQYPSDLPCLLQAAHLQREKKSTRSFQLLQDYGKSHPTSAMRVQLSLAQIQLSQGNIADAVATLQGIQSLRHRLAMVSTLVSLHTELGDITAAGNLIKEAVSAAEKTSASEAGDRQQLLDLLQFSAGFFLEHSQPEDAVAMLLKLRQADPSRVSTIAQLVLAYSSFNPQKAEELSAILPGLSELSAADALDVDKLESMLGVRQSRRAARAAEAAATGDALSGDAQKKKSKAKKKKKKRLPKNFDPDIKPDPERWLPRWERSSNQKRRHQKKKGMQVGKGTQGSAAGASDKFDASLQPAKADSPAADASPSPSAAAAASGGKAASTAPAAAKKKQKKKGKSKW
ncbi:signal recognition particle subunit SRP72-like [Sycon ciliatum]|uniref:signal recognition particle subunit SRP72-like n=1 Tax=Sycon ciliatum TaxID=27933 RepID=UPI0031F6CBBE